MPIDTNSGVDISQREVASACKALNQDLKVPNINELTSMFYNMQIASMPSKGYWTSSITSAGTPGDAWCVYFGSGARYITSRYNKGSARCVKK